MIANELDKRHILFLPLNTTQSSKGKMESSRLRLSNLLLIVLAVIAYPLVSFAQISWHQITDSEAGFNISFPGQPTYQTETDRATGLQTEIYKFFYTGRLLRITFAPLPQPVRSPSEFSRIYSEFAQQVVPQGGILLRQQKLPDGGRQYDTVANVKDGTIYGRTRFYLRKGRYYDLSFEMFAQDGIDEREAARFFSSFSFLNDWPKRRATTHNSIPKRNAARNSDRVNWYTFGAPDNDFVVEFPGKPSYQFDHSSGTNIPFHRYHYFYGENTFQVSYREDPEAESRPKQVIEEAVKIYTSYRKGLKVLRQIKIPNNGYQIDSQSIVDGTPFYSRTRIYVRGTRVYYVTVLIQNLVGPNKGDVNRFFQSFRFS
jgi:hypothetical protein